MGAQKKLRKQAALAELERLTQLGRVVGSVQAAVAAAGLAKGGRGMPPGEARERDAIARVLAKSDNMQLRAGAMQRLEELDGLPAAMDEAHRVITKAGRSR
jgi:ubiquinone biosynthesis protein UbiJ